MIVGIGVDNVELDRIRFAKEKEKFREKVLTNQELKNYEKLSEKRQTEFLSGRWAAKEAFSKAYGTGISPNLVFTDLEIAADENGKPFFMKHPFNGKTHLSISHTDVEAVAFVILESEDKI